MPWHSQKQDFGIGSAESEAGPRKRISDFLQRLSTSDGLTGAFTGDNGVGKSTLINLMMFNSGLDQQARPPPLTHPLPPGCHPPVDLAHAQLPCTLADGS